MSQCPKCNGPVIPATKTSPKSPDFVCANENCTNEKGYRSGIWNNDTKGSGGGAKKWQPKPLIWKPQQLGDAYDWSLKRAEQSVVDSKQRTGVAFTMADVLNGAATLFIGIVANVDPRPPAQPASTPPVTSPKPAPLSSPPPQLAQEFDDDLPF